MIEIAIAKECDVVWLYYLVTAAIVKQGTHGLVTMIFDFFDFACEKPQETSEIMITWLWLAAML